MHCALCTVRTIQSDPTTPTDIIISILARRHVKLLASTTVPKAFPIDCLQLQPLGLCACPSCIEPQVPAEWCRGSKRYRASSAEDSPRSSLPPSHLPRSPPRRPTTIRTWVEAAGTSSGTIASWNYICTAHRPFRTAPVLCAAASPTMASGWPRLLLSSCQERRHSECDPRARLSFSLTQPAHGVLDVARSLLHRRCERRPAFVRRKAFSRRRELPSLLLRRPYPNAHFSYLHRSVHSRFGERAALASNEGTAPADERP